MVVEKPILPPEVSFPAPPIPEGVEYSADGQTVYVPSDLWIQIAEYYIDVEETRKKYLIYRKMHKKP